jgi:hypothetical protein
MIELTCFTESSESNTNGSNQKLQSATAHILFSNPENRMGTSKYYLRYHVA